MRVFENADIQMNWLHEQVRVLEDWREEVARSQILDISKIIELEDHYAWLTAEIARLEQTRIRRAG